MENSFCLKQKYLLPYSPPISPHHFRFTLVACNQSNEEQHQEEPTERSNILFIMPDDHAYQAISAYGSQLIQTPNID